MKIRARDLSAIRIERVAFASAGVTIRGLFYHAQRQAACVVICHGYSSGKHNVDPLAFSLATEGYGALTFDFVGHKLGASDGVLHSADDLLHNALDAVAQAKRMPNVGNVIIAGHSMGAATAIGATVENREIAGAIAMCTAMRRGAEMDAGPLAGGLSNREQYVDGIGSVAITSQMDRFTARVSEIAPRPILVIAASRDAIVAPSAVHALYDAAGEPKTYELIDATHTDAAERSRFVVLRWLKANAF